MNNAIWAILERPPKGYLVKYLRCIIYADSNRCVRENRQKAIIGNILEVHQPIFWWLKYHLRRPSEAMALMKEDYDKQEDVFVIRRGFSSKKLIGRTKTGKIHVVPCHPDFKPIMSRMPVTILASFSLIRQAG